MSVSRPRNSYPHKRSNDSPSRAPAPLSPAAVLDHKLYREAQNPITEDIVNRNRKSLTTALPEKKREKLEKLVRLKKPRFHVFTHPATSHPLFRLIIYC